MRITHVAIALLCVALTACSTVTEQPGNTTGTIKVGVLAILTGPGATWGQSEANGAQLAVDEINAQGGVNGKRLALAVEDSKDDPKTVVSAYRKLRDIDGVQFMLGTTWSTEGLPLVPLAKGDDVVIVSPSLGVADFNEGADNLFNLWPHDALLSRAAADLVYAQGYRKVAVLSTQDAWVADQTDAFVARFRQLGGSAIVETADAGDKSQAAIAGKVKAADVDAIMFTNTITGDIAARRLREIGVEKPMFAITMGADTIAASDHAMDGLVFLSSLTPSGEFSAKYAARFPGQVLDVGADTAYDAIRLLAQAMRETGGEDPRAVAAYLNGLKAYEGASGNLTFDGRRGVTKEFVRFVVQDGRAVAAP